MSFSPDLVYWGGSRPVMTTRPGGWDQLKLGAGAPPIRVDEGWLILYHGVSASCDGSIYCLYAAILDADGMVKVYYGAADACVGLAEMPLAKMVESCYETGRFMR